MTNFKGSVFCWSMNRRPLPVLQIDSHDFHSARKLFLLTSNGQLHHPVKQITSNTVRTLSRRISSSWIRNQEFEITRPSWYTRKDCWLYVCDGKYSNLVMKKAECTVASRVPAIVISVTCKGRFRCFERRSTWMI